MAARHPNATRVTELFAAFRAGDAARIADVLGEQVVWRFPGRRGRLAGEHCGRDAVFAFLLEVMQLTSGSFHLDLEHVVADDDYAVAFFRGHATRNGRTLDNPTCLKLRIVNGKVTEVWEFVWDLYDVDDFWA